MSPTPIRSSLAANIGRGVEYADFGGRAEIEEKESWVMAGLLERLLDYVPEKRTPAQAVLDHEWFKM